MSRSHGPHLPEPVVRALTDGPDEQPGLTVLVLTVGEAGWPHVAMVSPGELLVVDRTRLALAVWPRSTCAGNLAREARVSLALITEGAAYTVACRVAGERALRVAGHPPLRAFDLEVADSTEDTAPYADLVAGVTHRLHDAGATLARRRSTRAALSTAFS